MGSYYVCLQAKLKDLMHSPIFKILTVTENFDLIFDSNTNFWNMPLESNFFIINVLLEKNIKNKHLIIIMYIDILNYYNVPFKKY